MKAAKWESLAWLLCAVPLVGLVELALHVKQTGPDVVPDADWERARDIVKADLKPDDLVVFEPFWADPIGRKNFGGDIATLKREGYSDVRRFARAWEVSIRGAHADDLTGWKKVSETKAGGVTVTLLEDPSYTPVVEDLLDDVTPEKLTVSRIDASGESPCPFTRSGTSGGSTVVPQGLLVPGDRFACSNGHAGVAVLHALDHHPHLCIYATPSKDAMLRLRFKDVTFGTMLHGHSGVQWVDERTAQPEKIGLKLSANDHLLGEHFHKVGAGWTGFELPTDELAGKKADLVVDVEPSGHRQFCFEASTRR